MTITLNGTSGIGNATWTTAGRPAAPVAGQQGFNTTTSANEIYSGTEWLNKRILLTSIQAR